MNSGGAIESVAVTTGSESPGVSATHNGTEHIRLQSDSTVGVELCALCAEQCVEDWYKCETCSSAECQKDLTETFYCDVCIVGFHVKKGHIVLDRESKKPLVCTVHKHLFSMFCNNCNVLLCSKCLMNHVNHNIVPIKAKAEEVRKNVFDELNKLEKQEKPTRALKENIKELSCKRAFEANKLIEDIEKQMQDTKVKIVEKVKGKVLKFEETSKEAEQNLWKLWKCQSELRNSLSCSSSEMIEQFIGLKLDAKTVHETSARLENLSVEHIASFFEPDKIDLKKACDRYEGSDLAESGINYLRDFQRKRAQEDEERNAGFRSFSHVTKLKLCDGMYWNNQVNRVQFVDCGGIDSIYTVEYDYTDVVINRLALDQRTVWNLNSQSTVRQKVPEANNTNICVFTYYKMIVLVCYRTVLLYNLNGSPTLQYDRDLPLEAWDVLCIGGKNRDGIQWIYWDHRLRFVRRLDDESFTIRCSSRPMVKMTCYQQNSLNPTVHLITHEGDILEVKGSTFDFIRKSLHRVPEISAISYMEGGSCTSSKLFLWSETRTILKKGIKLWEMCSRFSYLESIDFSPLRLWNTEMRFLTTASIYPNSDQEKEIEVFLRDCKSLGIGDL